MRSLEDKGEVIVTARSTLVLLALCVGLQSLLAHAAEDAPHELLETVYKLDKDRSDQPLGLSVWLDETVRGQFFSTRLLTAFDHAFEDLSDNETWGPTKNPFYEGQDFLQDNLSISGSVVAQDAATIQVTFDNFGSPQLLTYELIRTPVGWRIDDIRYGLSAERRLSDILSAN